MTWARNLGVDSATPDTLKATTAELLVAGNLPTRHQYFERRVMVFLVDNRLKIAISAAALVIGLWYLFAR